MSNSIREEKKLLRQQMASITKKKSESYFNEKDLKVTNALLNHSKISNSAIVLSYWSMPKEAATHDLNQKLIKDKKVLLPVINGNELDLKEFWGLDQMVQEPKFGIWEPKGDIFTEFDSIDLVIVPGVAFTKNGLRCGHGKGYYDKLLPKLKNAYTIGLAYDFQQVDQLPIDDFDVKLNEVIFI